MTIEQTNDKMKNLKVGMRFQEMLAVWLHILEIDEVNGTVKTLLAHGGNTIPPDGKVAEVPLEVFHQRFQYDRKKGNTDYWIAFHDEDNDFSKWMNDSQSFERDEGYDKYLIEPSHVKYRVHPILPEPTGKGLKDHQIQELVNAIRDNVEPLTKAQQLRERISSAANKYLESKGLRIDVKR